MSLQVTGFNSKKVNLHKIEIIIGRRGQASEFKFPGTFLHFTLFLSKASQVGYKAARWVYKQLQVYCHQAGSQRPGTAAEQATG